MASPLYIRRLIVLSAMFHMIGYGPVGHAQRLIQCDQLTSEQGLSAHVVYSLYQDRSGFLWAGTDYGLNRYDGYQFRTYHKSNADTTTLSNEGILCMTEDEQGYMWIGTYEGLNQLDPFSGHVRRFEVPGNWPVNGIVDIGLYGSSHLVLITPEHLFLFDILQKEFSTVVVPPGVTIERRQFIRFPEGGLGVLCRFDGKEDGIAVIEDTTGLILTQRLSDILPSIRERHLDFYFRDTSGFHFISSRTDRSFSVYHKAGHILTATHRELASESPLNFYCAIEVHPDEVWFGTNHGVFIYDRQSRQMGTAVMRMPFHSGAHFKDIRAMTLDRSGMLWMGTFGEGLLTSLTRSSPFKNIPLSDIIRHPDKALITGLYHGPHQTLAVELSYNDFSLWHHHLNAGYLTKAELTIDQIAELTSGKSLAEASPFHRQMMEDIKEGTALSGHRRFLFPNDTTMIHYRIGIHINTLHHRKKFLNELIKQLVEDPDYYWMTTSSGLYRIDKKTLKDTVYRFDPEDPYSISEDILYHVHIDSQYHLWIGTKGGGLNYYDRNENRFYHYTTRDGLPDNVVYYILPDRDGHLWLTTNNGLSRFDPRNRTFTNFNRRDGLINAEYNTRGGLMMPDGHLYFAGINGIDYFLPEEVVPSSLIHGVHIARWKVNDTDMTTRELVRLQHHRNHVTFWFTSNDFVKPALIYFRYRISNDASWTRVQGINTASYHDLRSGTYTFEVQASADNYMWSDTAVQRFIILTPWWRAMWFWMLCSVALLICVYALYRFRWLQVRRIQTLRESISRDLHDEVGSALSSIHLYSTVASRSMQHDPPGVSKALGHIHTNTQQVMEKMGDIIWAIQTGEDGRITFEHKVKNYGFELLAPLNINCTYMVTTEAEQKLRHMGLRRNLLLITKEAINNIARYSQATEASVDLSLQGNYFKLRIHDNGHGFDPDIQYQGNGLNNMRKRTTEMGGTLRIMSSVTDGTTLICMIPITKIRDMRKNAAP